MVSSLQPNPLPLPVCSSAPFRSLSKFQIYRRQIFHHLCTILRGSVRNLKIINYKERYSPSDMAEKASENPKKSSKKVNLLDQQAIKNILDESVCEIVKGRGYVEDVRLSNVRILLGTVIIVIALVAQFYKKKFKFPENNSILIGCIVSYVVLNILLQLLTYTKEKNAILFTYPPVGSFYATGLVVSSKLPRFSDLYTLTVASADPKSIAANKTVELTKSVTKWFTTDGVLVEGLFWKDVEGLINEYNEEPKKGK